VSDALGTATELRAMRNYAGHRLSPWLGHLMVSRTETSRQLLTPGEVMQLPPADEIVMVSGLPPIRAKKARYYEDERFRERILKPPPQRKPEAAQPDDWTNRPLPPRPAIEPPIENQAHADDDDPTESELRHQPELNRSKPVEKKEPLDNEFSLDASDDADDEPARFNRINGLMQGVARQASIDRDDDLGM
jgi:type IV secretion system protein VirD4